MTQAPVRMIIVDDHHIIWDSFSQVFTKTGDFQVLRTLASAANAEEVCRELRPDLLIMDVCTEGDASGLEALAALRPKYPNMKIIMMSGFDEISYAPRAKSLGADAFVFKSKDIDFFVAVARSVLAGGTYYPEPKNIPVPTGQVPLTERELEILRLLCMSNSRPDIADMLYISEKTVKRHVQNMLAKTDFPNMVELIIYVLANGWINPKY